MKSCSQVMDSSSVYYGNYSEGNIPRGDLECILTCDCEDPEQLHNVKLQH